MSSTYDDDFAYLCRSDKDGSEVLLGHDKLRWKFRIVRAFLYVILWVLHFVGNLIFHFNWLIGNTGTASSGDARSSIQSQKLDNGACDQQERPDLEKWLHIRPLPMVPVESKIMPILHSELNTFVFFASFYDTHLRVSAHFCFQRIPNSIILTKLRAELEHVLYSLQSYKKFRHVSHRLISFLKDFLASDDEQVRHFLRELVSKSQQMSLSDNVRQCYSSAFQAQEDKRRTELVLGVFSLFMKHDIHFSTYYLRGMFLKRDCCLSGSLNTLLWFISTSCGFSSDDVANYKAANVSPKQSSQILHNVVFETKITFAPFFSSQSAKKDIKYYSQALQWDFAMNFCDEFMDADWSVEQMERAAWALSAGKVFLLKNMFELVERCKLKPRNNFTFLDVKSLLSLSISGLIKFTGFDGCMFTLTANPEALFSVHGFMRKPSLNDLVELKLVNALPQGWFQARDFPGCSSKHKGVQIADRILMVRSKENTPFRASPDQKVG